MVCVLRVCMGVWVGGRAWVQLCRCGWACEREGEGEGLRERERLLKLLIVGYYSFLLLSYFRITLLFHSICMQPTTCNSQAMVLIAWLSILLSHIVRCHYSLSVTLSYPYILLSLAEPKLHAFTFIFILIYASLLCFSAYLFTLYTCLLCFSACPSCFFGQVIYLVTVFACSLVFVDIQAGNSLYLTVLITLICNWFSSIHLFTPWGIYHHSPHIVGPIQQLKFHLYCTFDLTFPNQCLSLAYIFLSDSHSL